MLAAGAVVPPGLRAVADDLPVALANQAIRDPSLGLGNGTVPLVIVPAIAILAIVLAIRRSRLATSRPWGAPCVVAGLPWGVDCGSGRRWRHRPRPL